MNMIGLSAVHNREPIIMNATWISRIIVTLQFVAYCVGFVLLAISAFGYASVSMCCGVGLGTLRFLLRDY